MKKPPPAWMAEWSPEDRRNEVRILRALRQRDRHRDRDVHGFVLLTMRRARS